MRYQTLLSPLQIGNLVIKNRLTYPNASPHFLQGPETYPAEGYRAFQANLAKNGAAIVNVAEWANYPEQRNGPMDMDMTHMQAFDMTDPAVHNYISQMCEEVHFYGSKMLLTTNMDYPDGYSLYGGRGMGPHGKPTEKMPLSMAEESIQMTMEKIRRYRNLGFDGVSFRCDMFLSPGGKERDDLYDGRTVEGRTRLFHQLCETMRRAFGRSFLIEAVVAWEQNNGYGGNAKMGAGYTEADTLAFCSLFDDVVDILEVREHDGCASHPTGYNFTQGVHPAVAFCVKAKAAGVRMLLKPIGGFQEPDEMERYLVEGKCDLFGMARAFMADQNYGGKLYAGQGEDITPCLKCNKCHGVMLPEPSPWTSICAVNPLMGLGHKIHRLVEATTPKKVAVIGGGPAGMRAAIYAAERGHDVTLYEKTDVLGGQLMHGDYFPFKWPIRNYKNWLIDQLGKHGVQVVMRTTPTEQMIRAGGFDAVLAATGAQVNVPDIPGLKDEAGKLKPAYMTCLDTCGREPELGKRVVMVGGSEVGVETAMYLAGLGHDVTVLTRQKRIAHNASRLHYITMAYVKEGPGGRAVEAAAWEQYDNIHAVVEANTTKVDGNTVTYQDAAGEAHTVTGDSVVICGGMTPLTAEAMGYAGLTDVFYPIGDCNGAGNLETCNREAFARAMIL